MPGVSVILPAFDRLVFLEAAVDSVLAQTYADWELVIADDGSAPQTRAYLQGVHDARVRILWLAHCGNPGRVRNAALAVATGRYVAFLDSEDVCLRLAMRSAGAECPRLRARSAGFSS